MTRLNFHLFAHSWVSDWNHGNAHFLRGLARALGRMGHKVHCYEELGNWSLSRLVNNEGDRAIEAIDNFRDIYRDLDIRFYSRNESLVSLLRSSLQGADVVLIHEWNDPEVANTILSLKESHGFVALFHDTHHRAYTNAREILRFRLDRFDAVLAFGEAIRQIYTEGFGVQRAFTFHEAADIENFRPFPHEKKKDDVVWIGNWGDEERTRELEEFLIRPAIELRNRHIVAYGVRYPDAALQQLKSAGIEFRGYLPNLNAPRAYARGKLAMHVPRRQYSNGLSGIPTIRMFEALACGAALLCSPWTDDENLFHVGEDHLVLPDGRAMQAEIEHLLKDDLARKQLSTNALQTISDRHTCAHRAAQLTEICLELAK